MLDKIGILTISNTLNYGALLQAYALCECLCKLGYEAEIINYENKAIAEKEFTKKSKIKLSPQKIYKKLVMSRALKRKKSKFDAFEIKHIKLSKNKYTEQTLQHLDNYDIVIVGSDQVWNMKITNNDLNYFLPLHNQSIKKLSYAASFGNVLFPEDYYDDVYSLLKSFKAVSVREISGIEKINKICNGKQRLNVEPQVVLDPTLLLNKEQWYSLSENIAYKKRYILVYFPHNKKKVFNFVKKLKKRTGLPVIYLSISPRIQVGVKTIYDASPEEWLSWMRYAEYVVTGSFHGVVFSINMGKQFFYETEDENSRIGNIVKLCGLENRSIDSADIDKRIFYNEAYCKINKLRDSSLEWLKTNLHKEG